MQESNSSGQKTSSQTLEALYSKAKEVAGRDMEVGRTKDGGYIALYMRFDQPPPPKGQTEQEALELFLDYIGDVSEKDGEDTEKIQSETDS